MPGSEAVVQPLGERNKGAHRRHTVLVNARRHDLARQVLFERIPLQAMRRGEVPRRRAWYGCEAWSTHSEIQSQRPPRKKIKMRLTGAHSLLAAPPLRSRPLAWRILHELVVALQLPRREQTRPTRVALLGFHCLSLV